MNLAELRTVQTKERQKDSLQHLRDSFYEDVADYITDLKAERDRAAAETDDPFSDPDVSRLTDEIETAEEIVEAVYERRVGKVVKLSSFAAAGMSVDEEGLTAQERDLFEDLVARIGENKTRVLDILAGEGDAGPASSPATETSSSSSGSSTSDRSASTPDTVAPNDADAEDDDASPARTEPAVGADDRTPEPDDEGTGMTDGESPNPRPDPPASTTEPSSETVAETSAEDRTTVRITADVGRVLGVDDREYDLASEDVVALPSDNADALLQRDAAERLE